MHRSRRSGILLGCDLAKGTPVEEAIHGNADLADSVNHLLVVGFYLINVGYVTLALRTTATLSNLRESIELLSDKVGLVLLILGLMHFFNLFLFSRMRKRGQAAFEPPPFSPDAILNMPGPK